MNTAVFVLSSVAGLALIALIILSLLLPKNPLVKVLYIVLGFISLAFGIVGIFLPFLPTTPFLLLTLFLFTKGSRRLELWFLGTKLYQKHLKSFNERRAMTLKTKITILSFSTSMLLIGFYFTPSVVGRSIIAGLIAIKYWFFFFWIKTEDATKHSENK